MPVVCAQGHATARKESREPDRSRRRRERPPSRAPWPGGEQPARPRESSKRGGQRCKRSPRAPLAPRPRGRSRRCSCPDGASLSAGYRRKPAASPLALVPQHGHPNQRERYRTDEPHDRSREMLVGEGRQACWAGYGVVMSVPRARREGEQRAEQSARRGSCKEVEGPKCVRPLGHAGPEEWPPVKHVSDYERKVLGGVHAVVGERRVVGLRGVPGPEHDGRNHPSDKWVREDTPEGCASAPQNQLLERDPERLPRTDPCHKQRRWVTLEKLVLGRG